jgi:acetyl-CoA acetyltransferase
MADVFIVGAATALLRGTGEPNPEDLAQSAATAAVEAAGFDGGEIEGLFVGCAPEAAPERPASGQPRFQGVLAGDRRCAEQVRPSSAEALHRAWEAIEMGLFDVVLCIGVDDPAAVRPSEPWPDTRAVRPYAAAAQRYMSASGATVEHLAWVAAKNHRNGTLNPDALGPAGVEPELVMESEMVAWPLRRLMVAPRGVGAAAVVLASAEGRHRMQGPAARVLACTVVTEGGSENGASTGRAARLAYDAAGIGPDDVDCAELHDLTAATELAAYESLQFAPEGQGPELIASGFTALGGVLPVNTSGGLLSLGAGQAVAIAQLCEIAWQVCGAAGSRQVAGARIGLVHSRTGSEQTGGPVALTILGAE